jgi:predicted component of type VI protein secretion system
MKNQSIEQKFQRLEKKLAYEQRQLLKKMPESNSRKRQQLKVIQLTVKLNNFKQANKI